MFSVLIGGCLGEGAYLFCLLIYVIEEVGGLARVSRSSKRNLKCPFGERIGEKYDTV